MVVSWGWVEVREGGRAEMLPGSGMVVRLSWRANVVNVAVVDLVWSPGSRAAGNQVLGL